MGVDCVSAELVDIFFVPDIRNTRPACTSGTGNAPKVCPTLYTLLVQLLGQDSGSRLVERAVCMLAEPTHKLHWTTIDILTRCRFSCKQLVSRANAILPIMRQYLKIFLQASKRIQQ